ncbi:Asparagine synthetase [glutamine-hydrolyzing] [Lamellibrachia satsuma]|nr:Asparagine synthetase [glutamine-hydrolyzing] [Lamellibrachia satsuma]
MQPMRIWTIPHLWLIYNGEIYNSKLLQKEFDFPYMTTCDGESIIHLYAHGGIDFAAKHLDGVFAFVLLDVKAQKVFVGRDLYGVRPCFRTVTAGGTLAVSSEGKGLVDLFKNGPVMRVEPFPPGVVETYDLAFDGTVSLASSVRFLDIGQPPVYKTIAVLGDNDDIFSKVRTLLTAAVRKRLMAERRIGCLLSGGLDSSLTAALATKLLREEGISYNVQTFAIGMQGSTDITAARKVADHIGSEHHEVIFTAEEGIEALDQVIYHLETYDITTVRASVGMYLISKYINEHTDSVVILSGEGADEVAQGYIYFHKAPSGEEADAESRRLLADLYMYDNLRGDRTTAAHGLELRVPFLDHEFVSCYLSLPVADRQPTDDSEKYLIRKAFDETGLLPSDILWRPKEAFSDGVSSAKRSWYEILKEHIEEKVSDEQLASAKETYPFNSPHTKEAYYYRHTFEKYFRGHSAWIPYMWMPKWTKGVTDPSARELTHYKQ